MTPRQQAAMDARSTILAERTAAVAKMYQEGARIVDIRAALNISAMQVYWSLDHAGVALQPRSTRDKPRQDRAISMYRDGMKIKDIAAELGVSRSAIQRDLDNVPRRPVAAAYMAKKCGMSLGVINDIPREVMSIVAGKIKRRETVIACMARLIVQNDKQG